jgi:ubiquitin carboxyl-terminal hydrolase 10
MFSLTKRLQLPWLSVPDRPFPARTPHRRRKGRSLQISSVSVELPSKEPQLAKQGEKLDEEKPVEHTVQEQSEPQTPSLSAAPSVADSTQPTTPSSAVASTTARSQSHSKGSKPAVPVVPVLPVIPGPVAHQRQPPKDDASRVPETPKSATASVASANETPKEDATEETGKAASPPRAAPKSWADLVRAKGASRVSGPAGAHSVESNGLVMRKSESLVDVLTSLGEDVSQYSDRIAFLEPRGLINTGNMCYMNSVSWRTICFADSHLLKVWEQVLQILVSCIPFYQFLDHVGRRASHSVHSAFPMVDAMSVCPTCFLIRTTILT